MVDAGVVYTYVSVYYMYRRVMVDVVYGCVVADVLLVTWLGDMVGVVYVLSLMLDVSFWLVPETCVDTEQNRVPIQILL